MHQWSIMAPSSEHDAGRRPLEDRFLSALLAGCGALLSCLFAAHAGAAVPLGDAP